MKIKTLHAPVLVSVSVLLMLPIVPVRAQDKTPSKALLARAKLSRADAEKIALGVVPNATVKASELEEEKGGLRWSFDLKQPGSNKITEVSVGAMTGKMVENKVENEKDEAGEKDDGKADEEDENDHKTR